MWQEPSLPRGTCPSSALVLTGLRGHGIGWRAGWSGASPVVGPHRYVVLRVGVQAGDLSAGVQPRGSHSVSGRFFVPGLPVANLRGPRIG